jgi:hypothetical protein
MDDNSSPVITRAGLEIGFALLTLAFGATIIAGALEFSIGWGEIGPEPGYFPFRIGSLIVLASLVNLGRAIAGRAGLGHAMLTRDQAWRLAAFALPVVAFVGLTRMIGIYVAAALYLLFCVGVMARHRLRVTVAVALGAPLVLFILFEVVFRMPLLKGPLEALFGWY